MVEGWSRPRAAYCSKGNSLGTSWRRLDMPWCASGSAGQAGPDRQDRLTGKGCGRGPDQARVRTSTTTTTTSSVPHCVGQGSRV